MGLVVLLCVVSNYVIIVIDCDRGRKNYACSNLFVLFFFHPASTSELKCEIIPCSKRVPNIFSRSCEINNDGCSFYSELGGGWSGCVESCPISLYESIGLF
jgi:hypothetical protein